MDKSPDAFRTISEVADFLETPAHVLRFWESRFPQIKPVKRAGGRRYYRPADVALLAGIRQLLHQDGMTIRGVQKILRDQGVRHVIALSDPDFGPAMDLDDRAEDALTDQDLPALAPSAGDEDQAESNIVALTDWRLGPTPASPTAELPALPSQILEAEQASGATIPDSPQAVAGASLVAEPEPEKETELPTPAPLQWSLFDAMSSGEAAADAAHNSEARGKTEHVSPPPHRDAGSDTPVFPADSIAVVVEAEASTEVMESHGADSPSEALPASAPPIVADSSTLPAQAQPWLPPRLRALQAAGNGAMRPDLLTILARARALHGRLRDAAQARRG